jgi:hypothetical protein
LILKIKCREYLRQVYEREVNKLESEGYFKACLRRSRFVGDEKRIALYQPIEEWLEQNRGEAKEK